MMHDATGVSLLNQLHVILIHLLVEVNGPYIELQMTLGYSQQILQLLLVLVVVPY